MRYVLSPSLSNPLCVGSEMLPATVSLMVRFLIKLVVMIELDHEMSCSAGLQQSGRLFSIYHTFRPMIAPNRCFDDFFRTDNESTVSETVAHCDFTLHRLNTHKPFKAEYMFFDDLLINLLITRLYKC